MKYLVIFILLPIISIAQKAEKWLTVTNGSVLFEKQNFRGEFVNAEDTDLPTVFVNPDRKFQEMDGFGFTLTGGSAMLIDQLSAKARKELQQHLFGNGEQDVSINFLRVSVGASDLDDHVFSYQESEGGPFSLAEDEKHLIPVLKDILKIQPKLKLMASPWSPPAWMKTNDNSKGGSLKPEYFEAYAQYLITYLQEMQKRGIDIEYLTIQNEPLHPGNNPSLLMYAYDQAKFIRENLGPALAKTNLKTKLLVYDHNADRPDYPLTIYADTAAAKYVYGAAFHLYGGRTEAIGDVKEAYPEKAIFFTEQWIGAPGNLKGDLVWHVETLMMDAVKNGCKTVLQWNLAADAKQEPHTPGGCTACLGALTIDGQKISKNPAYYIVAHASKIVPSGSVRIASNETMSLRTVAYQRPDGKIAILILNLAEQPIDFQIRIGDKVLKDTLPGGGYSSYLVG
jgi:glucosylceramidase